MYRSMMILAALLLCAAPLRADEGMWTYDNFPAEKVERAYGFRPDQRWLDHLRLSSVRLARGCSGAFVSPQEGKNSPQNRPQFGLKRLNRQNNFRSKT